MGKTRLKSLVLVVVLAVLFGGFSYAVRQRNLALETPAYCPLCSIGPNAKRIDPPLNGTVTGIVLPSARKEVVTFTLHAGKTDITVRTAPLFYLQQTHVPLAAGIRTKVYGWELAADGKKYIVAGNLLIDGRAYILRTPSGKPNYWER